MEFSAAFSPARSSLPVRLAIAGRDTGRLAQACRALRAGDRVEPLVLDLHDPRAVAHASEDCFAVACAAGPFQTLDRELPRVVAEAGAQWLDISEDRKSTRLNSS